MIHYFGCPRAFAQQEFQIGPKLHKWGALARPVVVHFRLSQDSAAINLWLIFCGPVEIGHLASLYSFLGSSSFRHLAASSALPQAS